MSSFCPHTILVGSFTVSMCDTETIKGQDILAWAWCHVDRSIQLLLSTKSGQREPTPMQAQAVHLSVRNTVFQSLPFFVSSLWRIKFKLFFFILEILPLMLNKFFRILSTPRGHSVHVGQHSVHSYRKPGHS